MAINKGLIVESQIRLPYRYAVGRWYGAFLLGLTEGILVGSRCSNCGKVAVPARGTCPICSAASVELVEVGPRATVVSRARDHRPGGRAWVLVRPEKADTNLLAYGQAEIGQVVEVEFDPAAGTSIWALKGFR